MRNRTIYYWFVLILCLTLSCSNDKTKKNEDCFNFNLVQPSIKICGKLEKHNRQNRTIYLAGPNDLNWSLRIEDNDSVLIQTSNFDTKDSALYELILQTEKDSSYPTFKSVELNQVIVIKNGKIDSSRSSGMSTIFSEKNDSLLIDFYTINNMKEKYLMQSWVFSNIERTNFLYTNWTSGGWNQMKIDKKSNLDTLKGLLLINGFTEVYNDSVLMTLERQLIKINLPLNTNANSH